MLLTFRPDPACCAQFTKFCARSRDHHIATTQCYPFHAETQASTVGENNI